MGGFSAGGSGRASAIRKNLISLAVEIPPMAFRSSLYKKQAVVETNARLVAMDFLRKLGLACVMRASASANRNMAAPPVVVRKGNVASALSGPQMTGVINTWAKSPPLAVPMVDL